MIWLREWKASQGRRYINNLYKSIRNRQTSKWTVGKGLHHKGYQMVNNLHKQLEGCTLNHNEPLPHPSKWPTWRGHTKPSVRKDVELRELSYTAGRTANWEYLLWIYTDSKTQIIPFYVYTWLKYTHIFTKKHAQECTIPNSSTQNQAQCPSAM